jgi:hypothetical protein
MTAAFRECDLGQLRQVARFPVVRQELQGGFAGAEKHRASGRPRRYLRAEALAKDCRALVFPVGDAPPREPHVLGSIAPKVVRVEGGRDGGPVYWRLSWTGSAWRLTGIDSASSE